VEKLSSESKEGDLSDVGESIIVLGAGVWWATEVVGVGREIFFEYLIDYERFIGEII
jgi:hypothetical protein